VNRYLRDAIFAIGVFATIGLAIEAGYQYGYTQGSAARKCAVVEGKQVVSSTGNSCTYASDYGLATKKRRAL
jgi:hypothetical protein